MSCLPLQAGSHWKCAACGFEHSKMFYGRPCPKFDPSDPRHEARVVIVQRYRDRNEAEIAASRAACNTCPHQTTQGEELDAGLCGLLVASGCGSCRNIEDFLAFRKSGRPCPDTPPRFPATELVQIEMRATQ